MFSLLLFGIRSGSFWNSHKKAGFDVLACNFEPAYDEFLVTRTKAFKIQVYSENLNLSIQTFKKWVLGSNKQLYLRRKSRLLKWHSQRRLFPFLIQLTKNTLTQCYCTLRSVPQLPVFSAICFRLLVSAWGVDSVLQKSTLIVSNWADLHGTSQTLDPSSIDGRAWTSGGLRMRIWLLTSPGMDAPRELDRQRVINFSQFKFTFPKRNAAR